MAYTPDIEAVKRLALALDSADRITVATHTHPDGDALGSSIAMCSYLREVLHKDAAIVIPDPVTDYLSFIPDEEDRGVIMAYESDPLGAVARVEGSDLLIGLDFNGFKRTEGLQDCLSGSRARKVLIDHHLAPEREDFDICISETGISSASELLFWILRSLTGDDVSAIPAKARRALMTGMTTDTNNFANSVFPSTLEMASLLLAEGVDRDEILENLYQSYRENRLRITGHILKDKMTILPSGIAYIVLRTGDLRSYDIGEGELEGVVNLPLGIGRVRMSIMLKQDEEYFRVSIRSKKGTSANRLAREHFNGGGHEQAAGGRLYFPKDIPDPSGAEGYIERVTSGF